KGATVVDTVQQVIQDEPVPPRRLQPKVPRDLETICLKCLHKEPAKRYATALELADDLRRFLDGKPIQARPIGTWERGVKWAKRRPVLAALVGVIIVAVAALGLGSLWLLEANRHAKAQQALAAANLQNALDMLELPLLQMSGPDPAKT